METYEAVGCRLQVGAPVEVGRAPGHFWFPSLHPVTTSDLLCEVIVTADKAQGEWPTLLYLSRDGGASWTKAAEIDCYGPASTPIAPDTLLLMPYELWPLSPGEKRAAAADGTVLSLADDGRVIAKRRRVEILDFPADLDVYHEAKLNLLTNGNILPLRNGHLFTTLYGRFAGAEPYDCYAVASDDDGATWRYFSTVGAGSDVPEAAQGPTESNTARLADGRLLCVYRVGSGKLQLYHKSYSADEGETWTRPEPIPGAWSVEPQLVRLENGALLLSGGREGLFLWVCSDGEGTDWEPVNLAAHHNALVADAAMHYADAFCAADGTDPPQSTAYTGMKAVGRDEALIVYDRLANGWAPAPGPWGDQSAVFCVRVKVTA